MSEENVEVVRKAIDAFNAFMRGEDTSEALINAELVDPQVEFEFQWHDQRTFPDEPQHLRGWPEFIGWCDDVREAWDELSIEALEFIEAPPDRVLTPVLERVCWSAGLLARSPRRHRVACRPLTARSDPMPFLVCAADPPSRSIRTPVSTASPCRAHARRAAGARLRAGREAPR